MTQLARAQITNDPRLLFDMPPHKSEVCAVAVSIVAAVIVIVIDTVIVIAVLISKPVGSLVYVN